MINKKELTADEAKGIKNRVETLTPEDKEALGFIYQRIRSAATKGESIIIVKSADKSKKGKPDNTTDKILQDKNRLDRDVFEMLEELDYRVIEQRDGVESEEWRTLISWRDSDLAEFSSFAFGLRHGGGFPII